MPQPIRETGRVTEAAASAIATSGRMPVQLISPGWGSSGYYSAELLAEAAGDDLFPAGTHMYADHPTPTDAKERPVRSIKDLMSVTAEPARVATETDVAEWGADLGALVADVDVLPAYRPLVEHFKNAIGVSILGDGERTQGEAEGRSGYIVESLEHIKSVDWVTRAGRGGRVLSLAESARANTRAIRRGVAEATVNDTREALQTALRDAHGADDVWIWVRDFDDDQVWFEIDSGDDAGVYGQTYTQDSAGAVSLTGDRTEVRVSTTYVPVARPDDSKKSTTEESEEDTTMGNTQIEESELARLREADGRVTALEERATTAEAERDQLREADALRTRTDRARVLVAERATEADVTFDALQIRGLVADLPLTEAGVLDEAAFATTVDEAAATIKAASGSGRIVGLGGGGSDTGSSAIGWDRIDEAAGLSKED